MLGSRKPINETLVANEMTNNSDDSVDRKRYVMGVQYIHNLHGNYFHTEGETKRAQNRGELYTYTRISYFDVTANI